MFLLPYLYTVHLYIKILNVRNLITSFPLSMNFLSEHLKIFTEKTMKLKSFVCEFFYNRIAKHLSLHVFRDTNHFTRKKNLDK
jgi:hypothetical protein